MELSNNHELQSGKYKIESKIGKGGFGITYRAQWSTEVTGPMGKMNTTVPVAIKEFFFEEYCSREAGSSAVTITSATGREFFEKFKNKLKKEAYILSRLQHPNIVKVLDVFEENNTAYIVMAFVEGLSLKELIQRNGKLDEGTVLKYAGQLCDALEEIHRNKILHLDIKPGNVLIDKNDNVQLIDFGISKQYNELHVETSTTPIGMSKGFAPFEQYSGVKEFTPATDIYSLGATLYNMLTGQIPTESIRRIDESLEPVSYFNTQVSADTDKAIMKAMSMKRNDRQQSVEELKKDLHIDHVQPVKSVNFAKPAKPVTDETSIDTPRYEREIVQVPASTEIPITELPIEWINIPAGAFMMGSPENERERAINEGPHHRVTLKGFKMSKYAVTFAQYDAFCEATGREKPSDEGWGRGNRPVINVSWHDAVYFCMWVGGSCRLPTEAEWEYACRAGSNTPFYTGDNITTSKANYNGKYPYNNYPKGKSQEKTLPVGSFSPNAWGLYDMHGNVWEWCNDWYGSYSITAQTNPQGSNSGKYKIRRGGSWLNYARVCRSAYRSNSTPSYHNDFIGFRVVSSE